MNESKIKEWRASVGDLEADRIARQASSRGTRIHKMLENYILKEDDPYKNAVPINIEMFNQIKNYIDSHVDIIYGSELQLYSDKFKLAGTTDLFCRMHGINAIVDFKTATKHKKEEWIENYFLQSAAYAVMVYERYNIYVPNFCILIATENDGLQFFWKQTNQYVEKLKNFLISIDHC